METKAARLADCKRITGFDNRIMLYYVIPSIDKAYLGVLH